MVCFAKTLEMDNFPFPEETDHIVDVRIIRQAEDVVIGEAGLLLCSQILSQVRNNITCDLHCRSGPGITRGKLRIHTSGMIHKIGVKACLFNLLLI